MLVERGVVSLVDAHSITVNCHSKIDCLRCAEGKGCGGGILARWLGNRQFSIKAFYNASTQSPKVGDFVAIAVPANRIVKLAAIMYALPLLLMVVLLVFQVSIFPELSELIVIALALVTLLLGFKIASTLVEKANKQGLLQPSLMSQGADVENSELNCKNRIGI